jgi:hypothetical protein
MTGMEMAGSVHAGSCAYQIAFCVPVEGIITISYVTELSHNCFAFRSDAVIIITTDLILTSVRSMFIRLFVCLFIYNWVHGP